MNEFELIEKLSHALPTNESVVVGAGDDCAVLDMGVPGRWLLFKTDAVVEGVHFTADAPPEKVGHKALGRCLSDIAAMAGTPTAALVTLGLPEKFDPVRVEALYAGMSALARRYGVAIAGGETTMNPDRTVISVALLGWVEKQRCTLRSGAKAGDAIFVTGELGGSLAGKHLEFEPRIGEARWLAEHFRPHAMIDLSDGLAGDLRHVLKASRVGAELLADTISISRAAKGISRSRAHGSAEGPPPHVGGHKPPLDRPPPYVGGYTPLLGALTDGEDFELLFTLASKHAVLLLDAWKKKFPKLRLSCIGKITAGDGVTIRDKRGARPLTAHGYVHFA